MPGDSDLMDFSLEFEAVETCLVCAGRAFLSSGKISWNDINFWYVSCLTCGLKFMNPRPTQAAYRDFYENLFWQQKVRNLGFRQAGQLWRPEQYKYDDDKVWDPESGRENRMEKQREIRAGFIIPLLADRIELAPGANILEVGCAFAVTLREIRKRHGCNVYGIEPSREARAAWEESGDVVALGRYAEDLEAIAEKDLKFDAVIFSHVLENTLDPVRVLRSVKRCLRTGGVVYIQTPNLLTFDQMNPYHPYIFSRHSLQLVVQKAGLEYEPVSDPIDRNLTALCTAAD